MAEWEPLREYLNYKHGKTRYILAPFIQESALRFILDDPTHETVIVTRWHSGDIQSGVSDLGAYLAARQHGWTFCIHPSIHLKAYSWDLEYAIVGSANITNRAVGLQDPANEELLLGPTRLEILRRLQLQRIVQEAQFVDDALYKEAKRWKDAHSVPSPEPVWKPSEPDRRFLISALPMSKSPQRMLEILSAMGTNIWEELDTSERNCAIHDACTFRLDRMGTQLHHVSLDALRQAFFDAPFIQAIEKQLQPCMQFGTLKAWIQANCQDVPVPSRRDLTGNVQVLLSWFEAVDPATYAVDIPGAYSQRLCNKLRQ